MVPFRFALLGGIVMSTTALSQTPPVGSGAAPHSLSGAATNSISVPPNVRPIIYFQSNRSGHQAGLVVLDGAEQLVASVPLGPQIPPGTCIDSAVFARTLFIRGFNASTGGDQTPATATKNESDPNFYDVNIYDAQGSVVVATASIGIPAASTSCQNPNARKPTQKRHGPGKTVAH